MGMVITNRTIQSGRCAVVVNFSRTEQDRIFAAGLLLGFRSPDRYYVQVQLGAAQAAYTVSEYVPGLGWRPVRAAGPKNSLRANHDYRLETEIRGQEVRVRVDDVPVLEVLLSQPFEGKQAGLIAAGEDDITFSKFEVDGDRPKAFVVMQYGDHYDDLYREVIKPQAERHFEVNRIDEKAGPGVTFQDLQREIEQSDLVIAEITPENANVFYELGYAHALKKPTILLAKRGGALPFDIRSYRVVFYDDSISGKTHVEADLTKHLEAISQSAG
jgi:hypothetical protein